MTSPPDSITLNGVTLTIERWAKKLGIAVATIHWRRRRGLPIGRVLAPSTRSHAHGRRWRLVGRVDRLGVLVVPADGHALHAREREALKSDAQ
jgi:hypothetical protein